MMDVDEVIEMFLKLSYEEVLVYWISGEREEVKFYKEFVERVRVFGFGESIVKVFEKFLKDF